MHKLSFCTIFILILVFFCTIPVRSQQNSDFRKVSWGMTKSEVKATEPLTPKGENATSLVYQDSVAGINMIVGYTFSQKGKQLIAGGYLSAEHYQDRNRYVIDYQALKNVLTKRYGNPKKDKIQWMNDFFKDAQNKLGLAVALGHVYYLTEWQTENTVITMTLVGSDYNIEHLVSFKGKAHKEQLEYLRNKAQQIYKNNYGQ